MDDFPDSKLVVLDSVGSFRVVDQHFLHRHPSHNVQILARQMVSQVGGVSGGPLAVARRILCFGKSFEFEMI